jgi:hypothetical protein
VANETDLKVSIGADSSGLSNALTTAGRGSQQFSANFKSSIDNLNVSLKNLNETLGAITENTQKTADATQHLSTVTNFLLTITGIKLVSEAVSATASGLVSLGSATIGVAASFASYAQSEAYLVGQTDAVRVSNDRFGGTLTRMVVPALLQAGVETGLFMGVMRAAPATVGVAVSAFGSLTAAISAAGTAAVEFAVSKITLATVASFALSFAYKALSNSALNAIGSVVRFGDSLADIVRKASRFEDAGSRMVLKTLAMSGNLKQFNDEANRTGDNGATDALSRWLAMLDKIPPVLGKTKEENAAFAEAAKQASVDLQSSFAALPNYTAPLNEFLVGAVKLLAQNTDQAKDWGKKFADVFSDVNGRGEAFLRTIENIDPKLIENFKTAQQTGSVFQMQAVVMQGISALTKRAGEDAKFLHDQHVAIRMTLGQSREEAEHMAEDWDDNVRGIRRTWEEAQRLNTVLQGNTAEVGKFKESQADAYRKAVDMSTKGDTLAEQIRIRNTNIDVLKAGIEAEPNNQAMKDKLAEELEALKSLNEARAGGNVEMKESLRLAQQEAEHGTNALAAAESKVKVAREELAAQRAIDNEAGFTSDKTSVWEAKLAAAKKLVSDLKDGVKATRIEAESLGETRGSPAWAKSSLDALNARRGGRGGGEVEQAQYEKEKNSIAQAQAEWRANQERQNAALALSDIKLEYSKMFDSIDADEKRHLITSQDASQKRIDVLRREDAAVMANYDSQLAAYSNDEGQYAALLRKKEAEHDAYLRKIDETETHQIEKLDAEAQTAAGRLTSGLQSALDNVVKGKSPWQPLADSLISTVTSTIAANLKTALASALEKAGISSIINGVMSGDTLKSAIGGATGGGLSSGIGSIFSGLGGLGALLAFDVGSWNVPSRGDVDGKGGFLALNHPGEMIIPAGPAAALRKSVASGQGVGGGGTTVHAPVNLSIQATDPQSFLQQLKGQAGKDIMQLLSDHVRGGAHLGLRGA